MQKSRPLFGRAGPGGHPPEATVNALRTARASAARGGQRGAGSADPTGDLAHVVPEPGIGQQGPAGPGPGLDLGQERPRGRLQQPLFAAPGLRERGAQRVGKHAVIYTKIKPWPPSCGASTHRQEEITEKGRFRRPLKYIKRSSILKKEKK